MPQTQYNAPIGLSYKHISTQTTTTVKAAAGYLDRVIVNSGTSGAVVTFYDNTTAAGTVIAVWTLGAGITTPQPALVYNANFTTGLTIVTATQNVDITVIFR